MTESYTARWGASLMNNYGTPLVTLVRGDGAYVYDEHGKRYLDLLAYGGPALGRSYATTDASPSGGRLEVIDHQPSYLARWQGGVGARLGSNAFALVGRYRLSEALRPVGPVRCRSWSRRWSGSARGQRSPRSATPGCGAGAARPRSVGPW